MHTCDLFDKYRDGELGSPEQSEFESHLAACESCRTKMFLLNNLVHILKQEESRPLDLADQIARKAFQKDESWASLVVSWLKPGTAWAAALSMMLVLFSFLWLMSGKQQFDMYSEYEKLMNDEAAINLEASTSLTQVRTDSEVMLWLAQGGESQWQIVRAHLPFFSQCFSLGVSRELRDPIIGLSRIPKLKAIMGKTAPWGGRGASDGRSFSIHCS
jgi:hypothetical protein